MELLEHLAYDIGNGFTGAFGYNGQRWSWFSTAEGTDFYAGQLTHIQKTDVSVTYANLDFATIWGLNGYTL